MNINMDMSLLNNEKEEIWALKKYALLENGNWKDIEIDEQHCFIILTFSQLVIVSKDVTLESLHLLSGNELIELFYAKSSIQVNVINKTNQVSKPFRICFADGFRQKSSIENCLEVVNKLQEFVSVRHPNHKGQTTKPVAQKHSETVRKLLGEGKFDVGNAIESFMQKRTTMAPVHRFLVHPGSHALANKALNFITNSLK